MTPRRSLTPRAKAALWQRQGEACAECSCKLKLGETEWDHVLALGLTGGNEATNFQGICHDCHLAKTASDIYKIRKADRQRKAWLGLKRRRGRRLPLRPFGPSRPFDTSRRRKFDGTVEARG